ncbi:hypothetical protein QNI16_17290 [Cytophagaceae bacterium YF14B1]|uniref:Lipoprotein n=1 Tax=Xanthocytophaga flava TaxID=3048013 RepID=A0AAE3QRT7_9BACT|nr:hypothetical protein [Xanthocytophaga flavus]MDJ1482263.1 hypothetical protein [Xanthocytophaga flavus]
MIKHILVLIFLVTGLISCKKTDPAFLKHFTERGEKTKSAFFYTKQINKQDLEIVMATNEVNEPLYNVNHRYFYGYKEKLNDRHYLISFMDFYMASYRFTNFLINWRDVYLCIYDVKENQVVSKLRIASADPVLSFYKEDNHTYTISSVYRKPFCEDEMCNKIDIDKDTAVYTYRIINNRFQLIGGSYTKKKR